MSCIIDCKVSEMRMNGDSSKHHMIGGDGPNSYAHNSAYQKELLVSAEQLVQEVIGKHLDPHKYHHNPFRIADFGCSVGPNTIFAVENIIGAVENRYQDEVPEFHVFFNDVIENDFNTLFKLLSASSSKKYFVAAAPGSFHGRIFPKATIHFAHCSAALHWLSRIPRKVTQRDSNKGRIHFIGAGKEVKDAYSSQFKRDMEDFLNARAYEVVAGGSMALVLICLPDGCRNSCIGHVFDILGSCLYDMAKMGNVSEDEVDCFNLPFYYPSQSELEAVVEANGMFCIEERAELGGPVRRNQDAATSASHLRAVIGVMVEERFGSGVVDELFRRFFHKLLENPIVDGRHQKESLYFVFLKRNE